MEVSNIQLEAIRQKVVRHIEDRPGFTQADFARLVGVPEPVVSLVYRGKFEAENNKGSKLVTENQLNKIRAFFQTEESIWETTNYKKAFNLFADAKINHIQGILDGPKGSGKSCTAEDFQRQVPKETFLITCSRDMGIGDFTEEIAEAVGIKRKGSRYKVMKDIGNALLKMDEPLLIFDEMEEVKTHLIYSSIKGIYDYKHSYRKVGMVLVGANDYIESLIRLSERRDPKSYPQLLSRFAGNKEFLDLMTMQDAKFICAKYYGITNPKTVEWLYSDCDRDYRRFERKLRTYLNDLKLKQDDQNRAA